METRIINIEKAITELTTFNRFSKENSKNQSDTLHKILDSMESFAVFKSKVESNTQDINKMGEKIDHLFKEISMNESLMQKGINANRDELKTLGTSRFISGLMISTAVTTFLFGYLFIQIREESAELKALLGNASTRIERERQYNHKLNDSMIELRTRVNQIHSKKGF